MARVGVFVCHCGTNIAATVDVKRVIEAIQEHPKVAKAIDYQYMCSDSGQILIKNAIKELGLDRVVVAACSPRLHELTFRRCLENSGLNPYLLEIANIREQCSWIHQDREVATEKAIALVRRAVFRTLRNEPLFPRKTPMEKRALIIGGGISGIQSAIDIALAGYKAVIVERLPSIGGRMAQFDKTFPTLDCAACILTPKMVTVAQNPNVTIHTYSEVEAVSGHVGNFEVKIRKRARSVDMAKCTGCGICTQKCPVVVPSEFDLGLGERKAIYVPFPQAVPNVPVIDRTNCLWHTRRRCGICKKVCPFNAIDFEQEDRVITEKFGAIIVATGFDLFDYRAYGEYGYGKYKNIITGLQFERMVNSSGPTGGHILRPSDGKVPKSVVFIQCIGSRDESKGKPYCSRLCCMYTAKHALLLKEHHPDSQTYVFYIDIRAAGKNYEEFVKRAQNEFEVIYLRGRVSKIFERGDKLIVRGADTLSGSQVEIAADMVVLATTLVARSDATKVARMLGIPYDQNGFFTEAHPKLAPVENVTTGVFLTGACQAPKDIPDTVATASAASVKACVLFANDYFVTEPVIAQVNPELCTGCLACRLICPFKAIETEEVLVAGVKRRVARVIESLCHGCGACVTGCRSSAIDLQGFTQEQVHTEVEALCL